MPATPAADRSQKTGHRYHRSRTKKNAAAAAKSAICEIFIAPMIAMSDAMNTAPAATFQDHRSSRPRKASKYAKHQASARSEIPTPSAYDSLTMISLQA